MLSSTGSQPAGSWKRERIKQIIKNCAGLGLDPEKLEHSTDLYRAGMTSYGSVVLMIALENEFELEFPDAMLSRSVFETIDSIASAIESLQQVQQ
ncbi:MAG: acyl carrier protein [Acidobacteriota bacterium]